MPFFLGPGSGDRRPQKICCGDDIQTAEERSLPLLASGITQVRQGSLARPAGGKHWVFTLTKWLPWGANQQAGAVCNRRTGTARTTSVARPDLSYHRPLSPFAICYCPSRSADRGLILGPSTSFIFGDLFARLKDRRWLLAGIDPGQLEVKLFDVLACPAHTADRDFAITIDQVKGRNIGQLISVRNDVAPRIIESYRESHAVLLQECFGLGRVALRDGEERDWLGLVNLKEPLKIRERVLTSGTIHFKEREQH